VPSPQPIPAQPCASTASAAVHAFHLSDVLDASFWHNFGVAALGTIGQIAEIVVFYILMKAAMRRLIHRVIVPILARSEIADGSHAARLRTLAGLLNSIVTYVLTFVFGVMLLRAFHLDPLPLLTTAGVAGLAIGFGAQKLVKDVISGFFILLENQYAVGDYVTIGTVTGVVEDVGMRTTRIRDDVGKQSRGTVATYVEIGVAVDVDIAKATEIVDAAGKELAEKQPDFDFVKPPSVQGISGMEAAKITLRVTCAVDNPLRLIDAQIALRSLIYDKLVEAGIALA
jgi:small conductance mechanosensitive channel